MVGEQGSRLETSDLVQKDTYITNLVDTLLKYSSQITDLRTLQSLPHKCLGTHTTPGALRGRVRRPCVFASLILELWPSLRSSGLWVWGWIVPPLFDGKAKPYMTPCGPLPFRMLHLPAQRWYRHPPNCGRLVLLRFA